MRSGSGNSTTAPVLKPKAGRGCKSRHAEKELSGLLIYYCKLSDCSDIGSVNRRKIIAMAVNKTVKSCDIAEFKGHLLSAEWWGDDPTLRVIDFDHGYTILKLASKDFVYDKDSEEYKIMIKELLGRC